jgi:hypothetical protein
MSPEQMRTGDFSNDAGLLWDVYSFGVIAFQILTGHLPRLDRYRQHLLQHPEVFRSSPAISYGELTELTESLLNQLEAEKPAEWPDKTSDRKRSGSVRLFKIASGLTQNGEQPQSTRWSTSYPIYCELPR